MTVLITVAWFLIAISILVAVHEFGHFFVARLCGVKVLRFSIGFGPRVLRVSDRSGTEYAFSAIPLGGYVKMLDEREAEVAEHERHLSYNSKPVRQRIAIAAAGPAANIILAFIVYWLLFIRGVVVFSPVIGEVIPDSPAEHAGLAVGQEIVEVDGRAVQSHRDVALALVKRLGETGEIRIVTKYPQDTLVYETPVKIESWLSRVEEPDPIKGLGIEWYFPPLARELGKIVRGSPAAQAGLRAGDVVLTADGEAVPDWEAWVKIIRRKPGQSIALSVQRGDEVLSLNLVPKAIQDSEGRPVGQAGVFPRAQPMPESMRRVQTYGFLPAVIEALHETQESILFVFTSLKKLIFGQISIKNLSGPIGIAKVAADQAQYGFWAFMSFLAQVSVVLAVLNILPIPVLDGGHILYCVIEWVKGKPLSERVQLAGVKAGMALLLCVMVVAFYNDILRL